jgi:hypothetical protein
MISASQVNTVGECAFSPSREAEQAACDASTITNTEALQAGTLPSEAQLEAPPEGPGTDGNKPLMRNRVGDDCPSAIGHTDGNNFEASGGVEGCHDALKARDVNPSTSGVRQTKTLEVCSNHKVHQAGVAPGPLASSLIAGAIHGDHPCMSRTLDSRCAPAVLIA